MLLQFFGMTEGLKKWKTLIEWIELISQNADNLYPKKVYADLIDRNEMYKICC